MSVFPASGTVAARSKPEFPRSISTDERMAAVAIPNADVDRSRILRLTEPLMADLRVDPKLAAKTVLNFPTKPL